MKHNRFSLWLTVASALLEFAGCSHKQVRMPTPTAVAPSDTSSYMDLEAGWKLKILVPLSKSAEAIRQSRSVPKVNGNTISLSTDSPVGYEISYYSVVGRRGGGAVKLKFTSAARTTNAKTVAEPKPPLLPFPLPRCGQHIRLIYLIVRSTQADHNMAILAAKHLDSLDAFTTRLKANPGVCTTSASDDIFCSWVPAGIAVRPEKELPLQNNR